MSSGRHQAAPAAGGGAPAAEAEVGVGVSARRTPAVVSATASKASAAVAGTPGAGRQQRRGLGRDPPGRARHARRRPGLLVALDPPVAIDEGAVLLGDMWSSAAPAPRRSTRLVLDGAQDHHRAGAGDLRRFGLGQLRRPAERPAPRLARGADRVRPSRCEYPSIAAPLAVGRALRREAPGSARRPAALPRRAGTCTAAVTPCRRPAAGAAPSDSTDAPPEARSTTGPRASAHQLRRTARGRRPSPAAASRPSVANQRRLDPVAAVHPPVVHPAGVADEVAVDLEIGAGPDPDHRVVAGVDGDVAALACSRGRRWRCGRGPRPAPCAGSPWRAASRPGRGRPRCPAHGWSSSCDSSMSDVGPVAALGHVQHRRRRPRRP